MNYIEFPKMGLHFEITPQLFSIGPFTIHWYGIITAVTFLVIILGILKSSPKYGLSRDDLIDLMLITTPVGIIGARIFYVLVNWNYYSLYPEKIYRIWEGGLAIYGGIIVGIITIYLFCRRRKINPLKLLDHVVVYLVLGQSIGRWGNFVNQELFGPNTELPWGMTGNIIQDTILKEGYAGVDPLKPVHPLFIYEALWSLIAFFILLWFRKRKKLEGEVFSLYMIFYGGARFTIDSLRFDLMVGNININRLIGLVFILAFGTLFIIRRFRMNKNEPEEAEAKPSRYRSILDTFDDESSDADKEPDELKNEDEITVPHEEQDEDKTDRFSNSEEINTDEVEGAESDESDENVQPIPKGDKEG